MIKIYKTLAGYIELQNVEQGCWINVTTPDAHEISRLQTEFKVPADIVNDILDMDERPRLEHDAEWTLIILRIPISTPNDRVPFQTVPVGVFISNEFTITICNVVNEVVPEKQPSLYKEQFQQTSDVLNFILRLFLRSATVYLNYLKHINQQTNQIEQELEKSIRNEELNRLLKMEKCLVYFITSIKANDLVIMKLKRSKRFSFDDEMNEDLYLEATIENRQAQEMAQIYSDIQSGLMDAFASVISNNLNVVMKRLTSISIILMIPTLIASFYGMNVPNLWENKAWAFFLIIVFSIGLSIFAVMIFWKKKWF